jgi:pyruvate,water dikinase
LEAEILNSYRKLGAGHVAVRSSGRFEDMSGASQRGQFKTILNVFGDQALLNAVATIRADGLRAGERLGVLVQQMVRPNSAGVMFTVSPETPAEVLIESAWGLGVSVVEGRPVDRFGINRDTFDIDVKSATKPDMAMAVEAGGISRVPCPENLRDAPSLTEDDARKLARLGLQLELEWGSPLDLEWALDGADLWILQARRIPLPDFWDRPGPSNPHDLWSRWGMADLFPDPVSPFTWSLASEHWSMMRRASFRRLMPGLDDVSFYRLFDCRLYFNVGALNHVVSLAGGSVSPARELGGPGSSSILAASRPPAARRWRKLPGDILGRILGSWSVRRAIRELDAAPLAAQHYGELEIGALSNLELWQTFLQLWDEVTRLERMEGGVDHEVFGAVRHLEAFCQRWLGDVELVSELIVSRDRPSDDLAGDLRALSRARNEVVDADVQNELSEFLARHGHRGRGELDWAQPRWIENPVPVQNLMRHVVAGDTDTHSRPNSDVAERRVRSRLLEFWGERWIPWRRVLFAVVLARARRHHSLRSMPRDRVMHLFLAGRRLLLKLGERLVREGALGTSDNLFLLTVDEITELIQTGQEHVPSEAIAARRRLQLARAALRPAPEVLGPDGDVLEEDLPDHVTRPDGSVSLSGRGASAGVASGPVRIIRMPADAGAIRLGDVLVIPAGDLGTTLYFPMAAAMVVERGSLLSHAVVLAREYGLPTVVGVLSAAALKDGDWVRVDGSRGTVVVIPKPSGMGSRATVDGAR